MLEQRTAPTFDERFDAWKQRPPGAHAVVRRWMLESLSTERASALVAWAVGEACAKSWRNQR